MNIGLRENGFQGTNLRMVMTPIGDQTALDNEKSEDILIGGFSHVNAFLVDTCAPKCQLLEDLRCTSSGGRKKGAQPVSLLPTPDPIIKRGHSDQLNLSNRRPMNCVTIEHTDTLIERLHRKRIPKWLDVSEDEPSRDEEITNAAYRYLPCRRPQARAP